MGKTEEHQSPLTFKITYCYFVQILVYQIKVGQRLRLLKTIISQRSQVFLRDNLVEVIADQRD